MSQMSWLPLSSKDPPPEMKDRGSLDKEDDHLSFSVVSQLSLSCLACQYPTHSALVVPAETLGDTRFEMLGSGDRLGEM